MQSNVIQTYVDSGSEKKPDDGLLLFFESDYFTLLFFKFENFVIFTAKYLPT